MEEREGEGRAGKDRKNGLQDGRMYFIIVEVVIWMGMAWAYIYNRNLTGNESAKGQRKE